MIQYVDYLPHFIMSSITLKKVVNVIIFIFPKNEMLLLIFSTKFELDQIVKEIKNVIREYRNSFLRKQRQNTESYRNY